MNEIALLIAFLAGHTFNTTCVQTQDNGKSGYAVDSLNFEGHKMSETELAVTIKRTMYSDAGCDGEAFDVKSESGHVKFSPSNGGFFAASDGEKRYNADWSLEGKKDQGSIGINSSTQEVRIARGMGSMRNSMLQLIKFKRAE